MLWGDDIRRKLTNFQEVVVLQGVRMIQDFGAALDPMSAVLGKSFIGAAILMCPSDPH